jgi:uncharacterized protein (DUF433 family)
MRATEYKHIVLDARGRPLIEGTGMKVRLLVLEHIAHGWSAEELLWQYPSLTLGQIHAALAYYYDHEAEMEAETREELARVDELRRASLDSPVRRKLRSHRVP